MADHNEVLAGIQRCSGVKFTALTPNIKGFQAAVSIIKLKYIFGDCFTLIWIISKPDTLFTFYTIAGHRKDEF